MTKARNDARPRICRVVTNVLLGGRSRVKHFACLQLHRSPLISLRLLPTSFRKLVIMMHPSRQAYVEEDEPEVSFNPKDLQVLEVFMQCFQSGNGSKFKLLAGDSQQEEG